MNRLLITKETEAQAAVEQVCRDIERRLHVSPFGNCHVNFVASILKLCAAQSCGKCVPCRIGVTQMSNILDDVLAHKGAMESLTLLENTALSIYDSADCAIGYEAANIVLRGLRNFRDDYESHVTYGKCSSDEGESVPCVSKCPARVDIPGYIALVQAGRNEDAIRLIRKDNPFPSVCGLICEHPCETRCRRETLDASINIRGLKRYAVEHCGDVPIPVCAPKTGKKVAVIGGGPAGLSAAYFLALMGHEIEIYEKRRSLGGMLLYGIPSYRLPREKLNWDIDAILSTGRVTVHLGVDVGKDVSIEEVRKKFDSVFIAIGAHTEKKLGIEGEDKRGAISAVQMLRRMGNDDAPDLKGRRVVIVGGGNVAMDAARTAVRLGAANVSIVYRRRQEDMTALPEEVEGAIAEGCELLTLQAPLRVESDAEENVVALWTQPQIVGPVEWGRPKPLNADQSPQRIPCDMLVLAIGQDIESAPFEELGVKAKRHIILTKSDGSVDGLDGVFSGGDCATGPATVIRAIEAGKVVAANIDKYLGFEHKISVNIEIPEPALTNKQPWGRVNMTEREASARKHDFEAMEKGMTCQEARQESGRCLRCDKFGYGRFRGGRITQW